MGSSSAFFLICVLHSVIAIMCGGLMMFYMKEVYTFGHGVQTATKLLGSTPHDQLLIKTSDSFSGLLLVAIGFLLLMVSFVKDRDFQTFFAKGCFLLHVFMAIWRIYFERKVEDLAWDWLRQTVGDVLLALSWVFFLVYSWRENSWSHCKFVKLACLLARSDDPRIFKLSFLSCTQKICSGGIVLGSLSSWSIFHASCIDLYCDFRVRRIFPSQCLLSSYVLLLSLKLSSSGFSLHCCHQARNVIRYNLKYHLSDDDSIVNNDESSFNIKDLVIDNLDWDTPSENNSIQVGEDASGFVGTPVSNLELPDFDEVDEDVKADAMDNGHENDDYDDHDLNGLP
ncbi:hypothetical protein RJT34_13688 [Clitoria ternatea]|uniref:DUF7865 domain-containing protein n=1 Tax=Clitoria ternatea TaxID=43366 RepID=A0AAN9PMI0_CLITE